MHACLPFKVLVMVRTHTQVRLHLGARMARRAAMRAAVCRAVALSCLELLQGEVVQVVLDEGRAGAQHLARVRVRPLAGVQEVVLLLAVVGLAQHAQVDLGGGWMGGVGRRKGGTEVETGVERCVCVCTRVYIYMCVCVHACVHVACVCGDGGCCAVSAREMGSSEGADSMQR